MVITPPSAGVAPRLAPPPRPTSTCPTPSSRVRSHDTPPPNGAVTGTPPSRTSPRPPPPGPTPRRETPRVVGGGGEEAEAGPLPQEVVEALPRPLADVLAREHGHAGRRLADRLLGAGRGDHHRLEALRLLRVGGPRRGRREQEEQDDEAPARHRGPGCYAPIHGVSTREGADAVLVSG